jgi:GT2 family glycosyltransferase
MIEIVSATRLPESEFWNKTALGISLQRLAHDHHRFRFHVAFANSRGLSTVYNARITADADVEALAFVHDDVWIDDYFLAHRILEGLKTYDVIGVAGTTRYMKGRPGWTLMNDSSLSVEEAKKDLSGAIAHGQNPFGPVSFLGELPADVEFLDGAFIAARKSVLNEKGVQFDPRFEFHFYDIDFCRSAREHGLRLGTWPICLTHQSGGGYGTPKWKETHRVYMAKWNE